MTDTLARAVMLFTGHGWRAHDVPGCFKWAPGRYPVAIVTPRQGEPHEALVRCERRWGHRGWHACDNATWGPEA